MRMILAAMFIAMTWKWGDWRNWKRYHSTILFFSLGSILLDYLTYNYPMFEFRSLFGLTNHTMNLLVDTFITFPCTVLLYLPYFPSKLFSKALYVAMWACIYAVIELIFWKIGGIVYYHGWDFWCSALFGLFIFIILPIHFKKPLVAYGISIILVPVLLLMFHVPMSSMK